MKIVYANKNINQIPIISSITQKHPNASLRLIDDKRRALSVDPI